jgi:hypothetical protein
MKEYIKQSGINKSRPPCVFRDLKAFLISKRVAPARREYQKMSTAFLRCNRGYDPR